MLLVAGARACGPPIAGTVVERLPVPVPRDSIYWGVYDLTTYSHDPDDDQATPTQDRDYTNDNHLRVRWHGFRDDCALGIETYHVTLLKLDLANATVDDWQEVNSIAVGRSVSTSRREHLP